MAHGTIRASTRSSREVKVEIRTGDSIGLGLSCGVEGGLCQQLRWRGGTFEGLRPTINRPICTACKHGELRRNPSSRAHFLPALSAMRAVEGMGRDAAYPSDRDDSPARS